MKPRRVITVLALLMFSVVLLVTGHMDLDWMVVAPRFDGWYFSVDFWEFAPYLRMGWHVAYVYTAVRVAVGWFMLGGIVTWLGMNVDKGEKTK